nr:MAG TPA: hypothetical protein [Caudoviricetes sp.]
MQTNYIELGRSHFFQEQTICLHRHNGISC